MNADLNIYSRAAPGVILVNLGTLGARGPGQGLLHAHINANKTENVMLSGGTIAP